ncbi:MAG: cell division protein FtsQ/DivIB [Pseudomonadota bacterium]
MGFRVRRLWRSRIFRRLATAWAPGAVILVCAAWVVSQDDLRAAAETNIRAWTMEFVGRPELALRRVEVEGADRVTEAVIRRRLAYAIGAPAMLLDTERARRRVEGLGWVAEASTRLEAPGVLRVNIRRRAPRLIWRRGETITLLARDGAPIEQYERRADAPMLPLVAGEGADRAAAEAEAIFAQSGVLRDRIRGLVRIGQRRWNIVFANGMEVMLPAEGALDALAYLAALEAGEGVLDRDIKQMDLRLKGRPTFRLGPDAQDNLVRSRAPKPKGEDA